MCLLELGNMSDLFGKSARNKILKYSKETIYHFNCGECMNWWSYASTLEYLKPDTIVRLSCPHCGYRTKVKLKENGET